MRRLALAVAISVVAAACGSTGSSDTADDAATGVEGTTAPGAPNDTAPGSADTGNPDSSEAAPGSPDSSGESGTGGSGPAVEARTVDDTRADIVRQATAPWFTDWSRATIELSELVLGIAQVDPRDAIPPIDDPVFETADQATEWIDDRIPGALVRIGDDARFYPLTVMSRHEIVNDTIGDTPVAITYCPLCNTALTFDRRLEGIELRMGVSGLLRNSDLVMWDHATTSLWQQVTGEAIVGTLAGRRLDIVPTAIVSFGEARSDFPDVAVLGRDQGRGPIYGINGYVDYSSRAAPFAHAAAPPDDVRFAALDRVVGVSVGDGHKAYPFPVISTERVVNDTIDGTPVLVLWGGETADALDEQVVAESAAIGTGIALSPVVDGERLTFTADGNTFVDDQTGSRWTIVGLAVDGPLAGTRLDLLNHRNEFWFAWTAFFPDADVYAAS